MVRDRSQGSFGAKKEPLKKQNNGISKMKPAGKICFNFEIYLRKD